MDRRTKTALLLLICVAIPFIIAAIRDYVIPIGPVVHLDNWRAFPALSAVLFITTYPLFVDANAWTRNTSAALSAAVGFAAGFLLQGIPGALFGVVFAFIGSAILTVSFSRDATLKNEEL